MSNDHPDIRRLKIYLIAIASLFFLTLCGIVFVTSSGVISFSTHRDEVDVIYKDVACANGRRLALFLKRKEMPKSYAAQDNAEQKWLELKARVVSECGAENDALYAKLLERQAAAVFDARQELQTMMARSEGMREMISNLKITSKELNNCKNAEELMALIKSRQ